MSDKSRPFHEHFSVLKSRNLPDIFWLLHFRALYTRLCCLALGVYKRLHKVAQPYQS
jgi:hypothetical protein